MRAEPAVHVQEERLTPPGCWCALLPLRVETRLRLIVLIRSHAGLMDRGKRCLLIPAGLCLGNLAGVVDRRVAVDAVGPGAHYVAPPSRQADGPERGRTSRNIGPQIWPTKL